MMHMKIYNETVQKGAGPFSVRPSESVCSAEITLPKNILWIRRVIVMATCSLFTLGTSAFVSVSPL